METIYTTSSGNEEAFREDNLNRIPLLIGSYTPPDKDGNGEHVDLEWYRQGYIFKDEDAYKNRENDICYIPEGYVDSEAKYTANDILKACKGNKELADLIFYELDWEHVETLIEDMTVNGEIVECEECGKLFYVNSDEPTGNCPFCNAQYDNE